MKSYPKKFLIATISMLMMVSMASIIYTPFARAHTPPWQIPTFAYVSVAANPVGKGQTVLIYMWLDKCPPHGYWSLGR